MSRPEDCDAFPIEHRLEQRAFMREQAIRRNEEAAQRLNELTDTAARQGQLGAPPEFACECGRSDCLERLEISVPEWRAVDRVQGCYVVAPGHVFPDIEDVIRRTERFQVVSKRP